MGQYYKIVNVDRKVYLSPHQLGCGAKLMEWSYWKCDMVLALMNLLANEWKGDRVFVIGDYAEDDDQTEPCYMVIKNLIDELGFRGQKIDGYDVTLYGYADEKFKDVSVLADTEDHGLRYIYNHDLELVIDIEKCPVEWAWYDKEESKGHITKVAPLPLLLAMGNDRGGGDYHSGHRGFEHVGTWCNTVKSIEVTAEPIDGLDYKEFAPDFSENKELIPYTQSLEEIRKVEEKYAKLG